jgi:hypothetical protein
VSDTLRVELLGPDKRTLLLPGIAERLAASQRAWWPHRWTPAGTSWWETTVLLPTDEAEAFAHAWQVLQGLRVRMLTNLGRSWIGRITQVRVRPCSDALRGPDRHARVQVTAQEAPRLRVVWPPSHVAFPMETSPSVQRSS